MVSLFQTSRYDVFCIFKQFGNIINVFVSKKFDHDYSKTTTFGFVTFRDTESAARSVEFIAYFFVNHCDFHFVVINFFLSRED